MNFAVPELLGLGLLLLPFLFLWIYGARRYLARLRVLFPNKVFARSSQQYLSWALQGLGLVCVVLALARPRWDFRWEEVRKKGSDLIVVLDVSRSMMADDLSPNRLSQAKRAILDILQVAGGDRMGLVLFSGAAFIQCPLTQDRETFSLFLQEAKSDIIPVQGTALTEALRKAMIALEDGGEGQVQGRSILLLSDGEDHQGDVDAIAEELAQKSIHVHALGVGAGGAPLALEGGGFLRDASGQVVVSRLQEAPLQILAQKTGGTYRRFSSTLDFATIYQREIRAGQAEQESISREQIWVERHMWASLLALFFFGLDASLGLRRSRQMQMDSGSAPSVQAAKSG